MFEAKESLRQKKCMRQKKVLRPTASPGEDGEGLARTSPERPSTITELTEHSSAATELLSRGTYQLKYKSQSSKVLVKQPSFIP